ncbi:hypothetical protein, partial [Aeromonas hydrophila]
ARPLRLQPDRSTASVLYFPNSETTPRTLDAETKAKKNAERQKKHREKMKDLGVTVTLKRELMEGLEAQLQAIRDGGSAVVLTPEQAGEILRTLRTAGKKQLRG